MKDKLEDTFKDKNFDYQEPNIGHFERFEAKLNQQNKGTKKVVKTQWHWLAVAASILLFFGYWLGNQNVNNGLELADVSPKMEETQNFYLATIHNEIKQIESEKTPENQAIIDDAFVQLEMLENAYQKLTLELKESNQDKRVIYAMIANFQQRLEVLQNLMDQLEEFKDYNELGPKENKI